jgi:hypothetical protein
MPVFNAKLQSDLDQLVDHFTKRRQWWDQTIARAEAIREKHRQESRQRAEELANAKTMADSFNKGHTTILKRSTTESDNLHNSYQQQTAIRDFTDNPLRGLPINSPASQKASFNPLYGRKFWARYEKHVKAGHHNLAERMLKSADGPLRRAMIFCTGGKGAVAAWRADIAAARSQLPAQREAWGKLQRVNKDVAKGEKDTAKIIRKMLGGDLRQVLQKLPPQAASSPELALLAGYANRADNVSLKQVLADLKAQPGFSLQTLKAQMDGIGKQVGGQLQGLRLADRAAQDRQSRAAKFEHSCRVAKRMETKTSAIMGGLSMDMTETLENYKLGLIGPAEKARKFADAAVVKINRWVDPASVESNLNTLDQLDFNPQALNAYPARSYAFNAASGSATRAKDFTASALKGAFSAVIAKPAARAWGSLQSYFHNSGPPKPPGSGGISGFTPPNPVIP